MTSTDVVRPFNKNRSEARREVRAEFGTTFNSPDTKPDDISLIQLLDKVPGRMDWSSKTRRQQKLTKYHQKSAALLHQRGKKLSYANSCDCCQDGLGVWRSCVVAPIYKKRAIHSYACSNCIHARRPGTCSLHKRFIAAGGGGWLHSETDEIRELGGLLAVVEEERQRVQREREERRRAQREQEERRRREEEEERRRREEEEERRRREEDEERRRVRRERKRQQREQERQRQQDRQQREREAESEALPRRGRQNAFSVVVPSPRQAAKQSSSENLLKELEQANESLRKTMELLSRLEGNSRVGNEDDDEDDSSMSSDYSEEFEPTRRR